VILGSKYWSYRRFYKS